MKPVVLGGVTIDLRYTIILKNNVFGYKHIAMVFLLRFECLDNKL